MTDKEQSPRAKEAKSECHQLWWIEYGQEEHNIPARRQKLLELNIYIVCFLCF